MRGLKKEAEVKGVHEGRAAGRRPGRPGRRAVEAPAGRTGGKIVTVAASGLAVLIAGAGLVVLGPHLSEPPAGHDHGALAGGGADAHAGHAAPVYEVGGLQLTVQDVAWMSHDMFGGPAPPQNNFPMPAQMMPGMQSDDVNRLHVETTVTNRTGTAAQLARKSFAVESPSGRRWTANPGDPNGANLLPGASMSLDLYFDVPLTETVANILFTNAGSLVRIPFAGGAPQHEHGY